MNRRGIISLLAGAPFAGKALAEHAVQSLSSAPPPSQGYFGCAAGQAELRDDERWDKPQRYVRAFSDRLNKLMWGK
jgi:hypothetical protein